MSVRGKCKYCGAELENIDMQENCPDKPFTITLTRAEIWGLIDDYHLTRDSAKMKLAKVIGREVTINR